MIKSWLAFIPVSLGLFMVLLDVSVLNVALPRIAEDFHAKMSDLQWVLNAYTLTMVVLLVLAGRIGDMVRRERYFAFGMAIFTLGSFLSAQSWSIRSLIASRIVQAFGGAILSGNSLAMVTEIFPPGERGTAMGVNAMLIASSFTLGPIIGGWLTTHLSWHWVFYMNVPIGIVSIVLSLLLLPPLSPKERVPIDLAGTILLAIGLGSLTLGIIEGQNWGWDNQKTLACFAVSIPYLIVFSMRELSYDHPILDLSLFRIRNFTVSVISTFIIFFGISSSFFVIPYFLQGLKGLSAEEAGYWMIAIPIMNTFVAPLAGRLSDRINPKYMMCFGPILFALGMFNMTNVKLNVSYWEFFAMLSPMGIGMGLLTSPAFNVAMSLVPPEKTGMANGTIRSINTLAQAMGVAVGGVLITQNMKRYLPGYENIVPDPGTVAMMKLFAVKVSPLPLVGLFEGFIDSMHFVFSIMMWLPVVSSILIAVFLRGEEHLKALRRGWDSNPRPQRGAA